MDESPIDVAAIAERGVDELVRQLRAVSGRDWVPVEDDEPEVPR